LGLRLGVRKRKIQNSMKNFFYILLTAILLLSVCGKDKKENNMQSVKIQYVKTENFEMQYARFGSGEKTIVLFPGLYTKSLMPLAENVAQYYERFTADYTVYMFDRVETPPEGYTIENMADDNIKVLDSLKITDAYVIGISMGGMIAQTVAVKRSGLVKKLFLGSTACKTDGESELAVSNWISLALKGDEDALNQAFAGNVYSKNFYQQYREEILSSLKGATKADLKRFAVLAGGIKGFDISERLSEIKCPVFCIGADKDKIFGAKPSQEIAEKTSGEYFIYENYGHAVYDEAHDYLERIEKFFKK